jgi:hypothetical protein
MDSLSCLPVRKWIGIHAMKNRYKLEVEARIVPKAKELLDRTDDVLLVSNNNLVFVSKIYVNVKLVQNL